MKLTSYKCPHKTNQNTVKQTESTTDVRLRCSTECNAENHVKYKTG
jgi:hypothetical protein